jgi:ABC-type Fe3+/spermidine/putrescine transport system ATPase subunit
VILGQRRVNDVKAAKRPLLFATSAIDVPQRWSVQHALIAAVRSRSLDREDRHHEYALAAEKWELASLLERRISTLSSTEIARVHFARIELLRPAILIADRMLEGVSASARASLADAFFRTLRVHGTTVISAPSSRDELALTDLVVVLHDGRVTQTGSAAELFVRPVDEAAASATGDVDEIRSTSAERPSTIIDRGRSRRFRAAHRPRMSRRLRGREPRRRLGCDLLCRSRISSGRWLARGVLSGGVTLRIELPAGANIHKGRLLPLRYDPARFTLIARERAPLLTTVPTDVVPPMKDTR